MKQPGGDLLTLMRQGGWKRLLEQAADPLAKDEVGCLTEVRAAVPWLAELPGVAAWMGRLRSGPLSGTGRFPALTILSASAL